MRPCYVVLGLAAAARGGALTKSTLRVRTWWRLLREYGSMKRVYAAQLRERPDVKYDLNTADLAAQIERPL